MTISICENCRGRIGCLHADVIDRERIMGVIAVMEHCIFYEYTPLEEVT